MCMSCLGRASPQQLRPLSNSSVEKCVCQTSYHFINEGIIKWKGTFVLLLPPPQKSYNLYLERQIRQV